MMNLLIGCLGLFGLIYFSNGMAVEPGPSSEPDNYSPIIFPDPVPPQTNKVIGSWAKYTGGPTCPGKRNFIFMVTDGFGPASETIAREFLQFKLLKTDKLAIDDLESVLPLDQMLAGSVRTKSASSWVTDSAAAATAMSTGHKTFNYGIGINEQYEPVATVLEAAKQKGYTTALVCTSRITHATPASWTSHVGDRNHEATIASQQIGNNPLGRSIDLALGGGLGYFIPKSAKDSYRNDDRDLLAEAQEKHGWKTVIKSRNELDKLSKNKTVLPMLGFLAQDHLDYEIDRDSEQQPSLSEMVDAALTILADAATDCSKPGFFLLIESSRIDMAAHSNDAPTHIHEILEYQNVINVVKSFTEMNPNTRAISVSDHETGAVSKGWQIDRMVDQCIDSYEWHPANIISVTMSIEKLAPMILNYQGPDLPKFIQTIIGEKWGISDLAQNEIDEVIQRRDDQNCGRFPGYVFPIEVALSKITATRARVGWNTNGHSGVDVNLYAVNAPDLKGSMDNTFLATYSALSLGYNVHEEMHRLKSVLSSIHIDTLVEQSQEYSQEHSQEHLHH